MPDSVPALTRCTRVQISSPTELFNLLLGRKRGKKSVCFVQCTEQRVLWGRDNTGFPA